MLTSPLPLWNDLIGIKKKGEAYWKNIIWTSRSGISIRLIIEEYRKFVKRDLIYVWIPGFFCGETEADFSFPYVKIIHYPVTRTLDPDWKLIKSEYIDQEADVFLFVHYFGVFHDPNAAKIFCRQRDAVLIEDCAHALYKYQKIGKTGDFALFSCHKLIPVPDGALIIANETEKENIHLIAKALNDRLKSDRNMSSMFFWRVKKAIQKIIKRNKSYYYSRTEHYFIGEIGSSQSRIGISKYSRAVIDRYSYEELKKIAYKRKENADLISYIVKKLDDNVENMIPDNCECPYFSVFLLPEKGKGDQLIDGLQRMGFPVMHWPDLPLGVREETNMSMVRQMSMDIIVVPIHQDIKPWDIAKKACVRRKLTESQKKEADIRIDKIETDERDRWEEIYNRLHISNITQHWSYGDVKKQVDRWKVERYIINKNDEDIGILQILYKSIFGKKIVYRINKGPIFIQGENRIENELCSMEALWKKLSHPCMLLYVPFSIMTAENYIKTIQAGWRNWNIYGFPTGVVDLTPKIEEIRKALNSKWRNQLKSSEKMGYEIKSGDSRFSEMMELYLIEQRKKKFNGVNNRMLAAMWNHMDKPLRFYYVEGKDGKLLAFDIFYVHGQMGTYYVGWNSDEGRACYLNNLLLFHAAIKLKEEGIKTLDLGGIEYIHTETVAKFKDGMNPSHFRQMGEFIRLG